MAAEITEIFNDLAREAENAATEYRYNTKKQAQTILQSTMTFTLNMPLIKTLQGEYRVVKSEIKDNKALGEGFELEIDYAALISDSIKTGDYSNLQEYVNKRDAKIVLNKEKYANAMTTGEYLKSLGYVSVREYLRDNGFTDGQITYKNGKVYVTIDKDDYPLEIEGIALTGNTNYASLASIQNALILLYRSINKENDDSQTAKSLFNIIARIFNLFNMGVEELKKFFDSIFNGGSPGFSPDKDYATLIADAIKKEDYSNLQKYVDERDAKIAQDKEKYGDVQTTGEYLKSLGYVSVRDYLNGKGFEKEQITYKNGKVCIIDGEPEYSLMQALL